MIEVGDTLPNLGTTVLDSTGALAAGGAVALVITLPDGSTASPVVANLTLGKYTAVYTATQLGQYLATWTVTGANAGVFSETYTVESPVGIVSLSEVKSRLQVRRTDQDEMLRSLILVASDVCEGPEGTDRTWRKTVVTNEVHTGGEESFMLFRAPVLSITSVSADGSTLTAADYDLNPRTGRLYNRSGYWPASSRYAVSVSYVAGAAQIPPGVRDGVVELVRHLYSAQRGGSGIPRQEEPDYTQPGSGPGFLVPNRVLSMWRSAMGASLG